MKYAFYFRFSNRDCRCFEVKFDKEIVDIWDWQEESGYSDFASDLESKTGIHDGEGSGNDTHDTFGFNSYEINGKKKREFVINEWYMFFVDKLGEENVGIILKEKDFIIQNPDFEGLF